VGRSKSIVDLQKSNQDFFNYTKEMEKELMSKLSEVDSLLQKEIGNHYKGYSDNSQYMMGQYSDLTTISEWSLESVESIIGAVKNALFGGKVPEGSQKENSDVEEDPSFLALQSKQLYIANAAFSIVSGVLNTFKVSTSTSIQYKIDAKPILPGMMLFLGVVNNSYNRKNFFTGEKIVQNLFTYKVHISINELKELSKFNDLQMWESLKEGYRSQMADISKAIAKLDIKNREKYMEELGWLKSLAEGCKAGLKVCDDEIAKVSPRSKLLAVEENEFDGMVELMKGDFNRLYSEWKNSVASLAS